MIFLVLAVLPNVYPVTGYWAPWPLVFNTLFGG
jgi:hypothetical protein